ncbi:MAG: hypothetical protein P4M13_10635, partial [Alphaproteobacteria bacterium]|nr:hypothetical protein [Alphaproteobacteria bacterium]
MLVLFQAADIRLINFDDAAQLLITDYGDGVDGAPTASSVPRWLLSQTHLREAVHGQVYQESVVCHGCRA